MSFLFGRNKSALPPSPVPALLRGSQVPSVEDARVINTFITKLSEDLARAAALASIPFDSLPRTQWPSDYRKLEEFACQHLGLLSRFIHK
ncbi:hypothetical protein FA13DRAFT_1726333 [Coprinellus micaceus]|uniref:Uncharacterized protein n=1 Tax=Coprinellus micaceus TaxID=71717 RepID=A0A4Y7TST0_COPMI|nr:hypothetical protein FA13DRAFT_1726333 [Coprinellus micaceus]